MFVEVSVSVSGVYRSPSADTSSMDIIAVLLSQYVNVEVIVVGDLNLIW